MDFYESLLYNFSEKLRAAVTPSDEEKQSLLAELMDSAACRTLEEIREVLDDERLDDQNCFQRIEEIVRLYEKLGSNGGSRHDF
jgi:hypothetical protein|nr:hypothetical protein [uncultured Oscillibacter sp.]